MTPMTPITLLPLSSFDVISEVHSQSLIVDLHQIELYGGTHTRVCTQLPKNSRQPWLWVIHIKDTVQLRDTWTSWTHSELVPNLFERRWYQSVNVFTNSITERNPCIRVRWKHFLLSWFSLICCFLFFVQNKATLLLHSSFFGDCERINSSIDLDVPRNRCSQRQILCNGIVHVLHLKLKAPSIKHSSTDECKLKKQQQHDIGLERMNSPSI